METARPTPDEASCVARVAAGLSDGLAYCAVLLDPELVIDWVSPVARQMVGWAPAELVGQNALDLIHPDDIAWVARLAHAEVNALAFGEDPADRSTNMVRIRGADGSYRSLEFAANNQVANPAVHGYVLMFRDATEQRLTIEVFERLAKGEPVGAVVSVVATLLAWQLPGSGVRVWARDVAGNEPVTEIAPTDPSVAVDDPRRPPVAFELNRAGHVVAGIVVHVAGAGAVTELCRHVVERATGFLKLALARDADAARLRSAAQTDALTGVWNRAGLSEALARPAESERSGVVAVLYIDIDNFKLANDRWGHVAGDAVLVETANRLRRCMRPQDVISRPGGDEFVVVCDDLPDAGTARALASRVVAALAAPVVAGDGEIACAASVGMAIGVPADDLNKLFAHADEALLEAKRTGKARLVTYGQRPSDD